MTAMAYPQRARRTCDRHAPGDPVCVVQDATPEEEMVGYLANRARQRAALSGVQQAIPVLTVGDRVRIGAKLAAATFAVTVFAYAAILLILSLPVGR